MGWQGDHEVQCPSCSREITQVRDAMGWQGDHEGRPYISSRTGKTCRGDPRGRPANLQKSQAYPTLCFSLPILFSPARTG